jgi:hypothetical protein
MEIAAWVTREERRAEKSVVVEWEQAIRKKTVKGKALARTEAAGHSTLRAGHEVARA